MEKELLINTTEFIKDSAGTGYGTWFLGKFLYWHKTLKKSLIALEKTQRQINGLLGFFMWFVIFSGWLAFLVWVFLNWNIIMEDPRALLFFWTEPHPLVLIFLLSLWFDLFLVYKNKQKRSALKKINYHFFKGNRKFSSGKQRYNVARAISFETKKILEDAFLLAAKLNEKQVTTMHFCRSALKNKEVQSLFIRLNVDAKKLVSMIDRQMVKSDEELKAESGYVSTSLERALIHSFIISYNYKQISIDPVNILLACVQQDKVLQDILYELEIDEDKIINTIAWFRINKILLKRYQEFRRLAIFKPDTGMNRSYTAIATPTLDHFSHDLTLKAKSNHLDLCIGRDQEINAIFEAFNGGHNGVLLVGPVGVGKSNIVNGLAQLMVTEDVPLFLKDKRLVEIDVSRLVSGADPATAQERLLSSINEANRAGNIILYFDNIDNLIGISAGSQESLDLSEVLAEAISRGLIYCISAATKENYSQYIENKALGSSMTTIGIKEPDTNLAIQILQSKVGFLEAKHDIYIVYSALEQAVNMSDRYLKDKVLPLKAIDLLEKAALIAAKNHLNNPDKSFCSQEEVAAAIEDMTGILATKVGKEESNKLLNLEEEIQQRLVGQVEAVKAVSASLRRARVAIKEKNRPIASFLFLGPTGVGKTELAKTVSDIYFGSEDYMIRLDMSEYQNKDSISKMIGDVNGGKGYLTEAVRKKPFSLILLDEVEKADSNILNLLLQLLDDGRLTDGQGKTISFSESIIIATSNVGAKFIQDQIKSKTDLNILKQELIDNYLREQMRPELINRFDGIIVFQPLSENDIFQITTLMLKKMKRNLADKGIDLKADKNGVLILAKAGYDPKFGARPLRRLLQEKVEDLVANKILAGELKRRDAVIINKRAEIVIEKAPAL